MFASSAWVAAYRMVRMVAAFGVAVWVARYLGPEQYGMLSYAVALVVLVMGITGPGLKDVVTRQLDAFPLRRAATIHAAFRLMLLLNAAMLLAALVLILLLRPDTPVLWLITGIIAIGNLFRAFEAYELWYHFRLKMSSTVLVQAASFFSFAFIKLWIIWWDGGLIWISVATGAELVGSAFGFWLLYQKDPPETQAPQTGGRFQLEKLIFRKSLPVMGGLLFMTLLFKADQLMLGRLSGDAEVGFYAIAAQFSEYWLYLAAALVLASYPNLLESRKQSEARFGRELSSLIVRLFYGALAITLVVSLTGEWLIGFFLGDAFAPSAEMLRIHIWAVVFIFMIEMLKKYYVIEHQLTAYIKISATAALLNIGLNFWLIPLYGGIGAAWATVAAYSAAGYGLLWLFPETRTVARLITNAVLFRST
nr:flippase [Cyclonatronum proteinivorum]